jgi:hypothetical protein
MKKNISVLTLSKAEGVIGRIRNVVKEGRTPKINEFILAREKKVLVLDMDTRWGSIYLIMDRLIEVKSSVQELAGVGNKNLFLTNVQWEQAEELRDILQRAFEVTKKLQFDDILLVTSARSGPVSASVMRTTILCWPRR